MKRILFTVFSAAVAVSAAAMEQQLLSAPVSLDNGETGWYPGICINKSAFIAAPAGTPFVVDYTLNEGESHSLKLATNWTGMLLPGFEGNSGEGNTTLAVTENGSYTYIITAETIDLLKNDEAIGWDANVHICGQGLTITNAYLELSDSESIADCPVDMTDNWSPGCVFSNNIITSAKPGWKIVMDYEMVAENGSFAFTTAWGGKDIPGYQGTVVDGNRSLTPISENGSYTYVIVDDAISKLADSDFNGWDNNVRIVGQGFKITKLELVRNSAVSGFVGIEADYNDAEIEYYNLQGVHIANPSTGIYLKKQGSKVSKVVIR